MALRAVFILADGRLAYERLLQRLQARIRSKYTIYCVQKNHRDAIYGVLFLFLVFTGNVTVFETAFRNLKLDEGLLGTCLIY